MNEREVPRTHDNLARAVSRMREDFGDDDFVAELIETFVTDARGLLATIETSAAGGDRETLRRAAHTLKSNCATFGADGLAALAAEVEHLAIGGEPDAAIPHLVEANRLFASLVEAIRTLPTGARR